MGITSIEWTNRSANPFRARRRDTGKVGHHCVVHSKGCLHCYSAAWNRWLGTGLPFTASSGGLVDLFLDTRPLAALLRLKKPQKFFMCDMTDMFLDGYSDEDIATLFATFAVADWHTFQVLTKRSDRMRRLLSDPAFPALVARQIIERIRPLIDGPPALRGDWSLVSPTVNYLRHGRLWPLPNVWGGVSCEDHAAAERRIPDLLRTPLAVRFVSAEPLLGPIDLDPIEAVCAGWRRGLTIGTYLDWVIIGGESGQGARRCHLDWVRSLLDQCQETGTPVFVKQLGALPVVDFPAGKPEMHASLNLADRKGGDMAEWPPDLRVRQFPAPVTEAAR